MSNKRVEELLKQVKHNKRKETIYKIEVGYGKLDFTDDGVIYKPTVAGLILNQIATISTSSGNNMLDLFMGVYNGDKYFKVVNGKAVLLSEYELNNIDEGQVELLELELLVHAMSLLGDSYTIVDLINTYKPRSIAEMNTLKIKRDRLMNYLTEVPTVDRFDLSIVELDLNHSKYINGSKYFDESNIAYTVVYDEVHSFMYLEDGIKHLLHSNGICIPIRIDVETINTMDDDVYEHIKTFVYSELKKHLYLLDHEIDYLESKINDTNNI